MESPLILFILKGENKIRKKKSRVTSYLKKNKSMTKNWFEGHVTYQEGYGGCNIRLILNKYDLL